VQNDDSGLSDEMLDYSIQTADEIIPNYFKEKTEVCVSVVCMCV
jgi:hypothetical protein